MQAKLSGQIDVAGFRAQAVQLLAHQVPPDDVEWCPEAVPHDEYAEPAAAAASRPRNVARAAAAIVPSSFIRLSEFVVLHRDPARFGLLYRLLWRLVHEPGLRNDALDPDMLHAQHMAHAVRRDIHKMKANLSFIELAPVSPLQRVLQVAWYHPGHHVVETVVPWFARRGPARWAIFTPERSVCCTEGQLQYAPGLQEQRALAAEGSDAKWWTCHDDIFGREAGPRPP